VWLVESPYFETFILLVIAANSILLGFADYGHVDESGNLAHNTWRNVVVDKSEPYFTAIFTAECMLKILAMGLVVSPHSYLRDGWNILDFVVVVSGCVGCVGAPLCQPLPPRPPSLPCMHSCAMCCTLLGVVTPWRAPSVCPSTHPAPPAGRP
jgi:hypothetical protein